MPSETPLFLGTNIPWHWFGYDIGGGAFDAKWFDEYLASVSGKSNIVRFFHPRERGHPSTM